jgi:hypothetical protein
VPSLCRLRGRTACRAGVWVWLAAVPAPRTYRPRKRRAGAHPALCSNRLVYREPAFAKPTARPALALRRETIRLPAGKRSFVEIEMEVLQAELLGPANETGNCQPKGVVPALGGERRRRIVGERFHDAHHTLLI